MEVNLGESLKVKSETMSDEEEVTVLEEEELTEMNGMMPNQKSNSSKAKTDEEYLMHDSMEAEMSHSDQGSHPSTLDSDGGMMSYPFDIDQGLDKQPWPWSRSSEQGAKDVQLNRKGSRKVRKVQCGICGTKFTLLKNAKRHYKCQHLKYFYWCKYCPNGQESRRYTRREFLEDHFRTQHPDMLCEVEEVNKGVPSQNYNLIYVDVYEDADEEEEEDGGVEMVSTSDPSALDRSILLEDSPRDAFDGAVPQEQEDLAEPRHLHVGEANASRAQYINLADYRNFQNDSQAASNSRFAQKRSAQSSSSSGGLSNKVARPERNGIIDNGLPTSDEVIQERDEGSIENDWVLQAGSSNSNQVPLNHGAPPGSNHPFPSPRSRIQNQNLRKEVAQCSPVMPSCPIPSANAQNCLIIGSAIPQTERSGKETDAILPSTSSMPPLVVREQLKLLSQKLHQTASTSTSRSGQIQSSKSDSSRLLERRQDRPDNPFSNLVHQERIASDQGNVVNSSSDANHATQNKRHRSANPPSPGVYIVKGHTSTSSALSCREVLSKYQDKIDKYIKEIDYDYDSSGKNVCRKTVKHIFVFNNSNDNSSNESQQQGSSD